MEPEDQRDLDEVKDRIFHRLIGEDGHGYCRTYGASAPPRLVYNSSARALGVQDMREIAKEFVGEIAKEFAGDIKSHLENHIDKRFEHFRNELMNTFRPNDGGGSPSHGQVSHHLFDLSPKVSSCVWL